MKAESNLFRVFAVLLALVLLGAYVFDRSGGNLQAAFGLDKVFVGDRKVEALNQRLDRLEEKLDRLLEVQGYPTTISNTSDIVADPFAASPPAPPAAEDARRNFMLGSKSAAVFDPGLVQSSTANSPPPPPLRETTPKQTPTRAYGTSSGERYQPAPNAPANPPPPVMLPGSKSRAVISPSDFQPQPPPQAEQVQQRAAPPRNNPRSPNNSGNRY